ncbi:MAG: NUDIX hydrolase [Clostridia bacterium]|nr:NUDIX hydrolase [Clostridia bacterium]
MNNPHFTVCGIVEINGKVLLVRHTYGTAKGRVLLPGGYVMEGELPTVAVEREIAEETDVIAKAKSMMAVQCKPDQWCLVFVMDYVSGTPQSDSYENNEVLLVPATEAIKRDDITNMSRELLTAYMSGSYAELQKSNYIPASLDAEHYVLFE